MSAPSQKSFEAISRCSTLHRRIREFVVDGSFLDSRQKCSRSWYVNWNTRIRKSLTILGSESELGTAQCLEQIEAVKAKKASSQRRGRGIDK